jgi:hypothetical protein
MDSEELTKAVAEPGGALAAIADGVGRWDSRAESTVLDAAPARLSIATRDVPGACRAY